MDGFGAWVIESWMFVVLEALETANDDSQAEWLCHCYNHHTIIIIMNIVCNGISYMMLAIISIMIMIIATHEHQIVHSHRVMTVITDTYMCF